MWPGLLFRFSAEFCRSHTLEFGHSNLIFKQLILLSKFANQNVNAAF